MGLRLEVAIDLSAYKIAIDELHRNARGCEKISRVFSQKPLDNLNKMCYNEYVNKGWSSEIGKTSLYPTRAERMRVRIPSNPPKKIKNSA